jgi:site-specific DNA-cytosine methylase
VVTASDASETGGGVVYGGKLTSQGIQEAYMVEEDLDELPIEAPCLDTPQVILVFDFFAGIGGLSRALQLAKVKVDRLVVVEKDPDCRRLNAVRWPGCDVWSDIEKLAKKDIERMMRSVPGITGVVAAGGSPCQGLSKLSCDRKHLEDPRSKLFYCYSAVLGWIEEVAEEMQIWSLLALENVLGDVMRM